MAIRNELEWCDSNMTTDYPLVSAGSASQVGLAISGDMLPTSFIVDFQLVLPGVSDSSVTSRFFISRVIRNADSFQIELSYNAGNNVYVVCGKTAEIPVSARNTDDLASRTFPVVVSYTETEYPFIAGLSGYFLIGSCIDMLPLGTLVFNAANAALISLRVYANGQGFSSIQINTARGLQTLTSNFILEGGDGVTLNLTTDPSTGLPLVTVNQQMSTATTQGYSSVAEVLSAIMASLGTPIQTINGVAPDESGNIVLTTDDCEDFTATGTGLRLSNKCAKPCCSDTSNTEDISSSIAFIEAALSRLEAYYTAQSNNINMIQARLASLIASRG